MGQLVLAQAAAWPSGVQNQTTKQYNGGRDDCNTGEKCTPNAQFENQCMQDLSHLPYSSFLACLDDITIQHPNVRRIADATAAATIKEAIATLVTPNVVHPGSGSGSGSGNRSGIGKGSRKRAGGYSGNQPTPGAGSSRGAGSPKSLDRISSEAQDGKKSTTEHATRGGQVQNGTVTTANYSTDGRLSEAKEKMVEKMVGAAKTTVVAAAEELETLFASGFRPDDQRLLVLLQQYVLVNSQAGREVSRYTQSKDALSLSWEQADG